MIYSYVQRSSTMFDLLKFIHHIKMLSELHTLKLFRLDTCTIWFVIWIHCKHWKYLRYLHSNFLQLKYQDHRDYCTQKQKQECNVAKNIYSFPKFYCFYFIHFTDLILIVKITHTKVLKGSSEDRVSGYVFFVPSNFFCMCVHSENMVTL